MKGAGIRRCGGTRGSEGESEAGNSEADSKNEKKQRDGRNEDQERIGPDAVTIDGPEML